MTDALIERLEKGDFRRCPFDDDNCKLMPEDACPVCGDMGTFEDNPTPSNCVSSNQRALANEAVQALKAKDAEIEAAQEASKLLPEGEWTVELQEVERPGHHMLFAADSTDEAAERIATMEPEWRLIRISRKALGGSDD